MADVSPPRRRRRENGDAPDEDRAQIILITGLTLAVLFVAVVLLLNTVIYTENLATRGTDAGGAEAIEFRDGVTEDLAGILHREHRNRSSPAGVGDDFNASAAAYANATADLRVRDGVIADVRAVANESGHFVAQEELDDGSYREMTDAKGTANWTVASDVERTRNYRLTVNSTSLSDEADDAFTIVADGADEDWSVTLSNGSANATDVWVRNATTDGSTTVSHEGVENITIDLTAGTIDGQRLPGPVWAGGVQGDDEPYDAYDIRHENGTEARGAYHLVVDEMDDPAADPDEPYGGTPSNRSSRPYVAEAVYSVDVELRHRTPELTYGDVIRLAPGERDA